MLDYDDLQVTKTENDYYDIYTGEYKITNVHHIQKDLGFPLIDAEQVEQRMRAQLWSQFYGDIDKEIWEVEYEMTRLIDPRRVYPDDVLNRFSKLKSLTSRTRCLKS